jgi:hypothetical protein
MNARPSGYYENALWGYTDASSYAPGETVTLFVSSPIADVKCSVARIGADEIRVHEQSGIHAGHHDIPAHAYRDGCGWPETFSFTVGKDWSSGYYKLQLRAGELLGEHFFVVRSASPGANSRHALVLATNTYQAYNSWGGRNLYGSDASLIDSPDQLVNRGTPSTTVAWDRPYSRCLVSSPVAIRPACPTRRGMGEVPGLPEGAEAFLLGEASIWDIPAGFVNKWEHQFVTWAERAGIALDYLVQSDLDANPNALDGYSSILSVGHDEYWSWEERDVVETFVDAGGSAIFLSANTCYWQVRFERERRAMVGYKFTAPSDDPVLGSDQQNRLTSMWSDPLIDRPETQMTGVTFSRAGYAREGYAVSRGTGGYTIYRPNHWSLAGTDLFYGDVIGDESNLVSYEVDGCAFQFEEGLPVATGEDGAPKDFEIVGMSPASLGEALILPGESALGRHDVEFAASRLFDGDTERMLRGHATFGSFQRGCGEVFTSGTTEWAWSLVAEDPFIDRITRNVLARAEGKN